MNRAIASSVTEPHLETVRVRFDSVLVALDLSPASANTVRIATEFAQRNGAKLIVAHVLDPTLMMPSQASPEIKETIERWMRPFTAKGMRWAIEVVEGDLVHEITRLAKQHHSDLLVIGTHAAAELKRLALGSKAEALFRNMVLPVLTVGPHVRACGERFSSILLPTDLEPHSLRAAQYAVALAEESNANLTFLHILHESNEESRRDATDRMKQLIPEEAALWCQPSFQTAVGDRAETILAKAGEVNADLIVLGVTPSRLLADRAIWSIASKVVSHAGCPVLTVRDRL